jgi:hypothetical protein
MGEKFTAGYNRFVPAGDGHRSATFDTAYNTVGSRFEKAPCMDPTPGGNAPLDVVQVVVVTGVKMRGEDIRDVDIGVQQGAHGWPGRPVAPRREDRRV